MADVAIGLVGAGRFARLHARALRDIPGCRIAAVCDPVPEALEAASRWTGDVPRYASLDELLGGTPVDALDVVSDEAAHGAQALAAVRRGLPVFVEKPLATTAAEAREIGHAAEAAGIPVCVGYVSRFDARYAMVHAAAEGGRLGRIVSVSARRGFSREWFAGFGARVHPVFESMIHDIDLALWYLGAPARRVYAQTLASSGDAQGVPDVLVATITTADGRLATLGSSWLVPASAPRNLPGDPLDPLELLGTIDAQLDVVGTQGTARVTLDGGPLLSGDSGLDASAGLWPEVHGRVSGALRGELEHFLACARAGRPSTIVPVGEAVAAVEIAEAVVESAAQDRPVTL